MMGESGKFRFMSTTYNQLEKGCLYYFVKQGKEGDWLLRLCSLKQALVTFSFWSKYAPLADGACISAPMERDGS